MIVFLPADPGRARALRDGMPWRGWRGFAVTSALRAALGSDDEEELDYAALDAAGVAALEGAAGSAGRRLVLAVQLPDAHVRDLGSPFGEVAVEPAAVGWPGVSALFADEPGSAPLVAAAARAVVERSVADAYDDPAVTALAEAVDLLWYAPEELDALG